MFSKACEYGLRASIFIAQQSQLRRKVSLKDVADAIESPEAYTSKILQQLSKNNIIRSDKGPSGGFSMSSSQLDNLKLSDVVFAIDGDDVYIGCGLGLKTCSEVKPCPVHHQFKIIRDKLKSMLENTYINSLAKEYDNGICFLKQ